MFKKSFLFSRIVPTRKSNERISSKWSLVLSKPSVSAAVFKLSVFISEYLFNSIPNKILSFNCSKFPILKIISSWLLSFVPLFKAKWSLFSAIEVVVTSLISVFDEEFATPIPIYEPSQSFKFIFLFWAKLICVFKIIKRWLTPKIIYFNNMPTNLA